MALVQRRIHHFSFFLFRFPDKILLILNLHKISSLLSSPPLNIFLENVTNERMKHDRVLYAYPTTSSGTTRVRESLGKVDGINEIPDSPSGDAERNGSWMLKSEGEVCTRVSKRLSTSSTESEKLRHKKGRKNGILRRKFFNVPWKSMEFDHSSKA